MEPPCGRSRRHQRLLQCLKAKANKKPRRSGALAKRCRLPLAPNRTHQAHKPEAKQGAKEPAKPGAAGKGKGKGAPGAGEGKRGSEATP